MRIDAHQHFWSYSAEHYGWIVDNGLTALERDFLPGDLRPLLDAHGIDGTIAVQAQQREEETRWLLGLADDHDWIRGVVGWTDLRAPDRAERIAALAHPRLVGIRHVVQGEAEDLGCTMTWYGSRSDDTPLFPGSADTDDASSSSAKELDTQEYAYYDSLPAPGSDAQTSSKRLRAH